MFVLPFLSEFLMFTKKPWLLERVAPGTWLIKMHDFPLNHGSWSNQFTLFIVPFFNHFGHWNPQQLLGQREHHPLQRSSALTWVVLVPPKWCVTGLRSFLFGELFIFGVRDSTTQIWVKLSESYTQMSHLKCCRSRESRNLQAVIREMTQNLTIIFQVGEIRPCKMSQSHLFLSWVG